MMAHMGGIYSKTDSVKALVEAELAAVEQALSVIYFYLINKKKMAGAVLFCHMVQR